MIGVVVLVALGDVLFALGTFDDLLNVNLVLLNDLPQLSSNMLLFSHLLLVYLHVALEHVCIKFDFLEACQLLTDALVIEHNRRALEKILNLVDHAQGALILHRVDVVISLFNDASQLCIDWHFICVILMWTADILLV